MRVCRILVLLALVSIVAVACGDNDPVGMIDGSTTMVTVDLAPITEVAITASEATETTAPRPSSTTSTTTTATPPATSDIPTPPTVAPPPAPTPVGGPALPGEPFDRHPPMGAVLGVVGVAHDDVLNVREFPGLTAIVSRLAPTAEDVMSAGEGRLLSGSAWWKINASGTTGWVNARFLAYLGGVHDLTATVVRDHGSYPTGPTMEALGRTVAETIAPEDQPSTIVMSVAPTAGDLGEVTYDVIGIGDDSQAGWRLHVFGAPEGGGFTLKSVEATELCSRGSGEVCL